MSPKTNNEYRRSNHMTFSFYTDVDCDDYEAEGLIYSKARDPPGQKCTYILPGNPEKETYRLSTFLKFPPGIEVDVCSLAFYGFYYTGYKDRVKCFSCGSNVYDWKLFDEPNDAQWHLDGCALVLGTDKRNQPIIKSKKLNFAGRFVTTVKSLDSGYESVLSVSGSSSGSSSSLVKNGVAGDKAKVAMTSSSEKSISEKSLARGLSTMQIDINNKAAPASVHQTAKVVQARPIRAPQVEGLSFASITSKHHYELLTKTLDLHKEEDRRKSFFGWLYELPMVTPATLAKSGFFYLGNADRVQCFSCSGVLRNWNEYDEVEDQHRRHFSSCRMVCKTEKRNIPILQDGPNQNESFPEPMDPSPEEMESLKRQFPCLSPVSPHMRDLEARIKTFDQRWPSNKVKASVLQIAKAGFFFLGERDRAKCWYCNGGLQNWEPNDEPFTEHAKWFPGCEYILQCKGLSFVQRLVAKYPNLSRPPLRNPRFDHRTRELIPLTSNTDDQLPVVIDPQAKNRAGNVLHSYSASSSRSQSQGSLNGRSSSGSTSLDIKQATAMGFKESQIQQVIERKIRSTGKNFVNVSELINALLEEQTTSSPVDPPEIKSSYEHIKGGNELISLFEAPSTSLKRNNDASLDKNEQVSNIRGEDETPFKKSKTGHKLTDKLADLENERKCKSCFKNIANNVVMDCGHIALCNTCAETTKFCPVCKTKVHQLIKAYLS